MVGSVKRSERDYPLYRLCLNFRREQGRWKMNACLRHCPHFPLVNSNEPKTKTNHRIPDNADFYYAGLTSAFCQVSAVSMTSTASAPWLVNDAPCSDSVHQCNFCCELCIAFQQSTAHTRIGFRALHTKKKNCV